MGCHTNSWCSNPIVMVLLARWWESCANSQLIASISYAYTQPRSEQNSLVRRMYRYLVVCTYTCRYLLEQFLSLVHPSFCHWCFFFSGITYYNPHLKHKKWRKCLHELYQKNKIMWNFNQRWPSCIFFHSCIYVHILMEI